MNLSEAYLDKEEKFWDYQTKPFDGSNCFDTSKAGMSFYDGILQDPDYYEKAKNLRGTIVQMTPQEYFEGCAKVFNSTVDKQIQQTKIDEETLNHLVDVLKVWKKTFPITVLNFADNQQEGRHRMYTVGELFGWNKKHPVLVIDWADPERHEREVAQQNKYDLDRKVEKATEKALQYRYYDIDQFEEELQFTLDQEFDIDNVKFEFDKNDNEHSITIKCEGGEYKFSQDEIQYKDPDEDDIEVDDDDLSDWMKDLLKDLDSK